MQKGLRNFVALQFFSGNVETAIVVEVGVAHVFVHVDGVAHNHFAVLLGDFLVQKAKPVHTHKVVGVHKCHKFALCHLQAFHTCTEEPQILCVFHHDDSVVVLLNIAYQLHRVVGRTVVHANYLKVFVGGIANAFQAFFNEFLHFVHGNNYAYQIFHWFSPFGTFPFFMRANARKNTLFRILSK